jgi:hypothetical protein
MPYTLTPEQAGSITDVEMAFSTERLLPPWEEIPEEFRTGNRYTCLAEAIFFSRPLPDLDLQVRDGFTVQHLQRVTHAHLGSFGPKHQHKIAGVGYLLCLMCELSEPTDSQAAA